MSSPPPNPSLPFATTAVAPSPILSTAPLVLPSAPMGSTAGASTSQSPPPSTGPPPSPSTTPLVYSPEAMTGVLNDLVVAVQGIRLFLAGPYGPPTPPPPAVSSGPPALPWYSIPAAIAGGHPSLQPSAAPALSWPQWPAPPPPASALSWPQWPAPALAAPPAPAPAPQWPYWPAPAAPVQLPPPPPSSELGQSTPWGLPIQQVQFPASPSLIPAWLTGTSPPPVYTEAGHPLVPTLQSGASSGSAGAYDGLPTVDRAPPSSQFRTAEPVGHAAPTQTPPRFAKIDFATYDSTEDPLNWLNQCDQFFRGQRTLESERTWLASYHLRGATQTWYYALKQDEGGMPPWERFHELCLLRFGPPIHGSRLAELGRLPFTSTIQPAIFNSC
nr:extensin-like [Aegilops tauschii subsp. strangulata]